MEKAILKTLIYADLFDYPLKVWEIHKWLIGKKTSLRQIEKAVLGKRLATQLKHQGEYFFLKSSTGLVKKRIEREKVSQKLLKQIKLIASLFRLIPFVLLVGISGSLAMNNASKEDDIDLFIITRKKRIWISRILLLLILELIDKRRKREQSRVEASGKVCINILLEEDSLAQYRNDIYLAHEVLQMMPLWQRGDIYGSFLESNQWVFRYLPNWIKGQNQYPADKIDQPRNKKRVHLLSSWLFFLTDILENLTKWFQLRYMGTPQGKEIILQTALYFHPQDIRNKVLTKYDQKIKKTLK